MNRRRRIRFVTGNRHKFQEAQAILSRHGLELEMIEEAAVEVQDDDLVKIATASVRDIGERIAGPIIVEDAGLFIERLNSFPGPYSAYVHRTLGCEGILKLMEDSGGRGAEFRSVIAYTDNSRSPGVKTFLGTVKGQISIEIRGGSGFGYDPIFIPEGADRTYGEMTPEEKNRSSHRARAFDAFASWYLANP